jgi:hypothetical protein
MTGYPEWNFPAFADAAERLRAIGYTVVSPAEEDLSSGFDPLAPVAQYTPAMYQAAMRKDIGHVLASDGVAVLPGWGKSRGARVEVAVAQAIGLIVRYVDDWEDYPIYNTNTTKVSTN